MHIIYKDHYTMPNKHHVHLTDENSERSGITTKVMQLLQDKAIIWSLSISQAWAIRL